jgi:hypothetical protein
MGSAQSSRARFPDDGTQYQWGIDITYIRTAENLLYLCIVMSLFRMWWWAGLGIRVKIAK